MWTTKNKGGSVSAYSLSAQTQIAQEYLRGGITYRQLSDRLGVSPATICCYVKEYRRRISQKAEIRPMTPTEISEVSRLEKTIRDLKAQVEQAHLKILSLETLIDVAEEQFELPIRKKPGSRQQSK